MIYYSNTNLDTPHLMFIGRWTPFHNGHRYIIENKLTEHPDKPILILIRETNYDQFEPHTRAEFIKTWMLENDIPGTIMIIPDIHGVYYGRGVGYEIKEISVPKHIKEISATNIRKGISGELKQFDWKNKVATKSIAKLLSPKVAQIIENGHVIWLTGCPCSGKTTIARALEQKILSVFPRLKIQLLDGDVMRDTPLGQDVGFSPKDREKHIRKMGQLAAMFANQGILVIASFVSPQAKVRNDIKKSIGADRFSEIYVKASKKERMNRDVKGMYAKAKAGLIKDFTGYDAPYEAPRKPKLVINTELENEAESTDKLFNLIFK